MNAHRLLIVEDDETLRTGLTDYFRGDGYDVTACADGHAAEHELCRGTFDLVILDLMLPGPSGLELLGSFRKRDVDTPVLILTARGDESDKVVGLELGADDYVTKPFGLRELAARVKAHLRRADRSRTDDDTPTSFELGDARVDLAAYEVLRDGNSIRLSPKEAAILALLFAERNSAVSRSRILDEVWGREQFVSNRTIDTHLLNLRNKIEPDPHSPRHLITIHGVGYRLLL